MSTFDALHEIGAGSGCERTSDTKIISSATNSDMEGLEINSMWLRAMTRNMKWLHNEIKSAAGPADCVVNLPFSPQKKRVENVEDFTEVKIFRATVLKPFSSNFQTTPASREKGI
jgi:hypothetical protein